MQEVLTVTNDVAAELAGVGDAVLDELRDRLACTILLRGNRLTIEGEDVQVAEARAVVDELRRASRRRVTTSAPRPSTR